MCYTCNAYSESQHSAIVILECIHAGWTESTAITFAAGCLLRSIHFVVSDCIVEHTCVESSIFNAKTQYGMPLLQLAHSVPALAIILLIMQPLLSVSNFIRAWQQSVPLSSTRQKHGGTAGAQEHWKSLKTDKFLQVQGTGGSILAMGDAATVSQVTLLLYSAGHCTHSCSPFFAVASIDTWHSWCRTWPLVVQRLESYRSGVMH